MNLFFENPTVLFYKNTNRPDSVLMNNVLINLEKEYPYIDFYQINTENPNDPIVLCYLDKTYRFNYANPQLLRDVIDRNDKNDNIPK